MKFQIEIDTETRTVSINKDGSGFMPESFSTYVRKDYYEKDKYNHYVSWTLVDDNGNPYTTCVDFMTDAQADQYKVDPMLHSDIASAYKNRSDARQLSNYFSKKKKNKDKKKEDK